MNLYKFHSEPESLDHHLAAHESVLALLWEKYGGQPAELKKREAAIATDARYAIEYAAHILKGPFLAGEAAIAKDTYHAYWYAKDVLKGRFPAGEAAIAGESHIAYAYATRVLKGPFPAGEKAMMREHEFADQYRDFLASLGKK